MLEQLFAKLLEEVAVIKEAPLTFFILWGFGAIVTYVVVRRSFRGQLDDFRQRLTDGNNVIAFLEKKVEIQQKFLEPTVAAEVPSARELSAAPSNEEKLLPPILELMHFDFENVAQDGDGFYFRSATKLPTSKAAILDFSLKPISGAVPWTEVQPQIRFKNPEGHITRVSNAIWLGEDKPKVPFRYGMTHSLVLVNRWPKRDFRTYERDSHASRPLERPLTGQVIRAEVRLIGEYMDDPKADVWLYFELIKDDIPRIIKSTREQFDKPSVETS